jgi:hypothetical protein
MAIVTKLVSHFWRLKTGSKLKFIHLLLFIYLLLLLFKNPEKFPFLYLNSVPLGGNTGPGKTQGAGRAAGRGWVRGGRPTKCLHESVQAAVLGSKV